MDNRTHLQPETAVSNTSSEPERRFKDNVHSARVPEAPFPETHAKTTTKRLVQRTSVPIYLAGGIVIAVCISVLFFAVFTIYQGAAYVESVKPDYSALDVKSDTYWTDRTLIDIETAQQSEGTNEQRLQRLQEFANYTVNEALIITSPYPRARAVTSIATVFTQHDINVTLDRQLQRLGNTTLIASMRARVMISQALMHLRQRRAPATQAIMQQYNQLVIDADLKLNSTINEESFFGAVTILWLLNDRDGLRELFNRQTASTAVVGLDQRMRAYRLIVGEQVRVGMTTEALETAKRINNHIELTRAWALILQYAAHPSPVTPVEPTMLNLLENPQEETQMYPVFAERAVDEIFRCLAENHDINTQVILLQRLVGSRLMFDVELREIFRNSLVESEVLEDRVKQPVLELFDNPESPAIRAALNMPPRPLPPDRQDSAMDDWTTTEEIVHVEIVDIDPTPLRTQSDRQWVQALLAVAQSYQSIRRFSDADRILKQTFVAAQKFVDPNVRIQLLLQIGEQQISIGSIADAKQIFAMIAPTLNQNQKGELARLQVIARLFGDAQATISSIETPENRAYACTFLLQEQIRLNRLNDAERTLTLMPQETIAVFRSRLNIAREQANREDYTTLGLVIPEGNNPDWEQHCTGLIRQGLLRSADQAADHINDAQKRADIRRRITGEYQLLYQAFNDVNDPNRSIRQEIRQSIVSVAERTGQPIMQTTILTELLLYHAGQLRAEEDRAGGKRLWQQAMNACRSITVPNEKANLFAQLIVAKNMLENPNLTQRTMPLFTRETHPSIAEETNRMIDECLELVNSLETEEQRAKACVHLARALLQIGRTTSVQILLNNTMDIAALTSDYAESVSMLLSMIPTLRGMNSTDTIPVIYRLAIDAVAHEFISRSSQVDEFGWRMRDSKIERIIRSQMENGFVDDAIESTTRLNEPVLRDRLLRTAAYIYLDNGDKDKAELTAQRIVVKEIQDDVLQNIQTILRRSTFRPLVQNVETQSRP